MSQFSPQHWNDTPVDNGRNTAPDPGTYEVLLHDARAFTSKAGDDYIILELKVAAGPEAGHEWTVMFSFANDKSTRATKTACSRLGMTVDGIATLDEFDHELKKRVGNWYTVNVRQNGEWRNTYFNDQVTASAPPVTDVPADTSDFQPAATATGTSNDDDVIPF